jgi:hypothetical protein
MTSDNFIIWLRGFASAVGDDDYPTSIQWDIIKEQLDRVKNTNSGGYTISTGTGGVYGTTTTTLEGRADVTYKQDELTTNTIF